MGAIQIFVIVFFSLAYAVTIGQHGTPRKTKENEGTLFLGFLLCHTLYYFGDFYFRFGWPQMGLVLTDSIALGIYSWRKEQKKTMLYNGYLSLLDWAWTFGCLWAGGFFNSGNPQI